MVGLPDDIDVQALFEPTGKKLTPKVLIEENAIPVKTGCVLLF